VPDLRSEMFPTHRGSRKKVNLRMVENRGIFNQSSGRKAYTR